MSLTSKEVVLPDTVWVGECLADFKGLLCTQRKVDGRVGISARPIPG